jgi:hypothetical protein
MQLNNPQDPIVSQTVKTAVPASSSMWRAFGLSFAIRHRVAIGHCLFVLCRWLFDCFGEAMQLDVCYTASFVLIADARVNIPILRPEHECHLDNGASVI